MKIFTSSDKLSKMPSSSSKSYSPDATFWNVSVSSSPMNGDSPLNRTYVMTPKDHMSHATVIDSNFKTSGAVKGKRIYKLP